MTYDDALKIILNKQRLGIKPGLERVYALLSALDNPQDKLKIIHIAGTNGKGTVAASTANALATAGYKTGLFTSPWIYDYREQIMLDGREISKDAFALYVDMLRDFDTTEFELLTAIMYKYFYDSGADYAVVECGMGGRLDATNTEKNNLAVVTSVSLDHMDFLGDSVVKIAAHKAGIIKENCACVLYPNPECELVFETECRRKNARLIKVSDSGDFNKNNLSAAQAALDFFGVSAIAEPPHLTARQEKIGDVLLDGGHNVGAAEALEPIIEDEVAVIGMMADKQVEAYLSLVAPKCRKIYAVTVDNPRAMSAEELCAIAKKYCADVTLCPDPLKAVQAARGSGLSLVCGSFYLVRQIIKEFRR